MQISQRREAWAGAALVFLSLAALTWLTNRNGQFFDDEIFTINLLAKQDSAIGVIRAVNSTDLHPPLAYVLDFLLYQMTGSWKAVQLAVGLVNAAALATFAALAHRALPRPAWLILSLLLASCATATMWGASLRWYGWFNPVFAVALALVLWGRLKPAGSFALLAGFCVALFHIGYLAMIAIPLLVLGWAVRYWSQLGRKLLHTCLAIVLTALAICLPQIDALVHVHLEYPIAAQFGSLPVSLAQTAVTMTIGNAVFPLGLLPIATALMAAIILALALRKLRRDGPLAALWLIVLVGAAAMTVSGLGYRPRNSVFLLIAALPLLASALAALPFRTRIAALALLAVFQLQGLYNVAMHQGTAKRSFNTPYNEIMAALDTMTRDCRKVVLVNNDDVLSYLTGRRYLHTSLRGVVTGRLDPGDCIVLEQGPAGEFPTAYLSNMLARLGKMPLAQVEQQKFAPEPQLALAARLLDMSVEDHAAVLTKYRVLQRTEIMLDAD